MLVTARQALHCFSFRSGRAASCLRLRRPLLSHHIHERREHRADQARQQHALADSVLARGTHIDRGQQDQSHEDLDEDPHHGLTSFHRPLSATDPEVEDVANRLPAASEWIRGRLIAMAQTLNSSPSPNALANLSDSWTVMRSELTAWNDIVTRRATQLERELSELEALRATWSASRRRRARPRFRRPCSSGSPRRWPRLSQLERASSASVRVSSAFKTGWSGRSPVATTCSPGSPRRATVWSGRSSRGTACPSGARRRSRG